MALDVAVLVTELFLQGLDDALAAVGDEKCLLREAKTPFLYFGKELLADLVVFRRPLPEPEDMLMTLVSISGTTMTRWTVSMKTAKAEIPKGDTVSMTVSPYRLPDMPRRAFPRSSSEKAPGCFRVS
jgi:hypothetical protein